MTSQLNEAKQETSIQLFELKDEITRLTEKNRELEGVFTGQPQFGDEPTHTYKCIQRIWRKGLKKLYYSQAKGTVTFYSKIIICYCHYFFPILV